MFIADSLWQVLHSSTPSVEQSSVQVAFLSNHFDKTTLDEVTRSTRQEPSGKPRQINAERSVGGVFISYKKALISVWEAVAAG